MQTHYTGVSIKPKQGEIGSKKIYTNTNMKPSASRLYLHTAITNLTVQHMD